MRARRSAKSEAEVSAQQMSAQLERTAKEREDLRMVLQQLARAIEHDTALPSREAREAEQDRVRALAQSMLGLSPEKLGLEAGREVASHTASSSADLGEVPPSHSQMLLQAALTDPLDATAALDVFSKLLSKRPGTQREAPSQRSGSSSRSVLVAGREVLLDD